MKRLAKTIALTLLKIVVVFYTIFPFYWAIVSSFKSGSALFSVDFFPAIDLTNYRDLLNNGNFLRNILNSAIVAVSVVTLSLVFAITSAYALGKMVASRPRHCFGRHSRRVDVSADRRAVRPVRYDPLARAL